MPTELVGDPKTKLDEAAIRSIPRPHSSLLTLYFLQAAITLLAFPFVFLPLLFKYHTLRYTFDDEGISAAWGILFKREIHLTYRRIQDIHVSRNLVERWLGIENAHEVRDTIRRHLRQRGASAGLGDPDDRDDDAPPAAMAVGAEVRDALRELKQATAALCTAARS